MSEEVRVVVAGHICLDVIPSFAMRGEDRRTPLTPGSLIDVGPAVLAPGGTVSNTGLALHRLGIPTTLMGKVGDDLFGKAILDVLRGYDDALVAGMIVGKGEASSYSVVLNLPGVDRIFLHHPGANDTFGAADVDAARLAGARLFHFGYPPLMRRMYADEGAELATLMRRVKAAGLTTSLDMAYPDPGSAAGRVDWEALLARVLPHVDVFLPSLDEMLFMLRRHSPPARVDGALLGDLGGRLLGMGAAVVVLKLGDQGLYARTTQDAGRRAALGAGAPPDGSRWARREMLAPCFRAEVAGTTGAGDATIAGFLAGLLKGLPLEAAMTGAVAVGACNVESPDATSGVPSWERVQARIEAGWERRPVTLPLDGWRPDDARAVWRGPHDHPAKPIEPDP